MYIQFTNTDSTGAPVTERLTVTLEHTTDNGLTVEVPHEIEVASTGTANVSKRLGEYLVESPDYAIEAYESESESENDTDDEPEIERESEHNRVNATDE